MNVAHVRGGNRAKYLDIYNRSHEHEAHVAIIKGRVMWLEVRRLNLEVCRLWDQDKVLTRMYVDMELMRRSRLTL